jgi:hypothetical protein
MECEEAQPFVSVLHDGETVPAEAARHIGRCPTCKGRLHEYARMAAEMRLLASTGPEDAPHDLPALPPRGSKWRRSLTARVLVPRFALILGALAVVGLSVGFGLMRAQSAGLWFQFDVSSPETGVPISGSMMGAQIHAGEPADDLFVAQGPHKWVAFEIRAPEVETDVVKLVLRARAFEPVPGSEEEKMASYQAVMMPKVIAKILAGVPFQELEYKPGQTLEIPVEGGGKVLLKGSVYHFRPSIATDFIPTSPNPKGLYLTNPALVRGDEYLGQVQSSFGGEATNSAVGICVPRVGALIFALKPFEGAVPGTAEFGQAQFEMDDQHYILFSATPITGGEQPREIWVYRKPTCAQGQPPEKIPLMLGGGDVTNLLDFLKK